MGLKSLSVQGWKGWSCSSTACTGCPKRPGGSDRPRKRKLNKNNVKCRTPPFHFQGDCEKRWWKSPSQTTQFLQKETQKKDYTACLPLHNRAIILSRPLTSHHLLPPVVLRSPKLFLLLPRAAFHWGRKKDRTECAAKTGLLSPVSHHCKHHINLWTNQQEGRELLCDGSSFNSMLLLCASQQHQLLNPTAIQ